MFRRADWMNGLEGWRRLVRHIDRGQAIRLETFRRQVQDPHTKPIKSLEEIEEGVASFENIMAEYVKAGGPQAPDGQMKADFCFFVFFYFFLFLGALQSPTLKKPN